MARSEAQKAADKRYKEKHKNADVSWGTRLKPGEAQELDDVIKASGLSRAGFLRWALEERKKQAF